MLNYHFKSYRDLDMHPKVVHPGHVSSTPVGEPLVSPNFYSARSRHMRLHKLVDGIEQQTITSIPDAAEQLHVGSKTIIRYLRELRLSLPE